MVADEVRTLARRTQESTTNIQAMIERLYSGVQETKSVMDTCLDQTGESVQRAQEAQQALNAITGSAATISDLNTQIASAALEQSTVAEDINNNVVNISTVAGKTTRVAEAASKQTAQLGAILTEVVTTLGQYHSQTDWQYQLSAAATSHLLWKVRVRGFLDGHLDLSEKEAVSHHECKFGRWYDAITKRRGLAIPPSLKGIETPHMTLHALIKRIIECSQAGRTKEAESLFAELNEVSAQILALLETARREASADSREETARQDGRGNTQTETPGTESFPLYKIPAMSAEAAT